MGILETAILYGILGLVVAAAMALREREGRALGRALRFGTTVLFWPLFAPALLGPALAAPAAAPSPPAASSCDARLTAAGARLEAAFARLGPQADGPLGEELDRLRQLARNLGGLARRLDEMDTLLRSPEFDPARAGRALAELSARAPEGRDPRVESVRARLRNIERLRAMRERTAEQLDQALLRLDEVGSQLELLRFADLMDVEAAELVREVADSVRGITEGLLDDAERTPAVPSSAPARAPGMA